MKHKISLVVFVAAFFCSTCIVGLGYVVGMAGGLGLVVNIVQCRNATTKVPLLF